jgi:hypothetical protein
MGTVGVTPGSFPKSGKQRGCGIPNLEQDYGTRKSAENVKGEEIGLNGVGTSRVTSPRESRKCLNGRTLAGDFCKCGSQRV